MKEFKNDEIKLQKKEIIENGLNEDTVNYQTKQTIIPSLEINKYLKSKMLKNFSDIQKKNEEKFKEKLGDNYKYVEILEITKYHFSATNGFSYIDGENKRISNALIVPLKQQNFIDEETTKSFVEVKGFISPTGEELPTISVPINEIERCNWISNSKWGLQVIFTIPEQKKIQINCIKELSKNAEIEDIYQYTGWTEIDGKRVFLHAGGAIGIDKTIKVNLEDEVLNRYCFTEKEFEIRDTLKMTLEFLKIAPLKISLPILSLVYMSVFSSIFEDVGIPTGFLTVVIGPQNTKKTSLVTTANSSFGNFDRSHTQMNFLDSISSIKIKVNKCKDLLLVADDYFPSSNKQEASEMKKVFEELVRLCFDRVTGARSKSNGKMRKVLRAKGQVIATAEKIPDVSESRMTRILFIHIKNGDVEERKLKLLQEHQEEMQYSMKKFIEYINNHFEEKKNEVYKVFNNKLIEAVKEVNSRIAEMLVGLYIGYMNLINFANVNGAITDEDKKSYLNDGWETLIELGKEQELMRETASPIKMFLAAIETLINREKLYTVDYNTANTMKYQDIMKDGFVGYFRVEKNGKEKIELNLIYPDLFYIAIKNFYNQQGILFPWSQSEMCKELFNQGYLYITERQKRPQIRRDNPRTGNEETFIALLQNKLYIPYRYNNNGIIYTK